MDKLEAKALTWNTQGMNREMKEVSMKGGKRG